MGVNKRELRDYYCDRCKEFFVKDEKVFVTYIARAQPEQSGGFFVGNISENTTRHYHGICVLDLSPNQLMRDLGRE